MIAALKDLDGNNALTNVFKTEPIIEPEKSLIHGSMVLPMVEPRSNW